MFALCVKCEEFKYLMSCKVIHFKFAIGTFPVKRFLFYKPFKRENILLKKNDHVTCFTQLYVKCSLY